MQLNSGRQIISVSQRKVFSWNIFWVIAYIIIDSRKAVSFPYYTMHISIDFKDTNYHSTISGGSFICET